MDSNGATAGLERGPSIDGPPPEGSGSARLTAQGRVVLGTCDLADLGWSPSLDNEGPTLSEILQQMRDEDER
jgi:hypothetical protein